MSHRKFHCYCVGAAKTGTTSVAKAFGEQYKSAHEPDLERVFRIIRKSSSEERLIDSMLKERDEELQLEMESSHPIIFLTPHLVKLFPEAKFIITIREPRDWLSSRLDFHYKKRFLEKERISYPRKLYRKTKEKAAHLFGGPAGSWKDYNNRLESNRPMEYSIFDSFLKEFNVSPIEFYLAEYTSHYKTLFDSIPSNRRLVVDLDSLNGKYSEICSFLGIPCTITPTIANINRGHSRPNLINEIDSNYITECIATNCGWYYNLNE